ncbi:putative 3-hydroxyisobutyrate dehydrogenase, mitochondrial [Vitis vinifera]|uniref:3-hydroxyisobutyrate dehydrogenase n=1 Tax=Vitis vinifera TaxID=29760 RepID=A0A438HAM9_VITVI|nr:putative 3-hydroxyisobutyrate dehydrogenase, mitochondrial [Vitis vinifera]
MHYSVGDSWTYLFSATVESASNGDFQRKEEVQLALLTFPEAIEFLSFQNVGFIGLGNMGSRMANNLIKAGYKVAVHDINHEVMRMFAERGVPTKETPFEIAETSDVVITMLPSSSHVSL